MKAGYLSEFFSGVGIKRLSAVEANRAKSNQHEFNGITPLRHMLGENRQRFKTLFIYLSDNEPEPVIDDGYLTWYDSREGNPNRAAEFRLYFPSTAVSERAVEGDILVIAKRTDGELLEIIVQGDSTIANQVLSLFNVDIEGKTEFSAREELETEHDRIDFVARFILEKIGIAVETTQDTFLDRILAKFGAEFPPTKDFSAFARSTVDIDAREHPDAAVMAWMEREEVLFRTLEKHIIAERLTQGFHDDVEGFLSFSLSVQNRRKSRVGFALENHMETIFKEVRIRYARGAISEGRSRPDFLFPGGEEYRTPQFDPLLLTMLGVKSTCKDRWRQVLAEARLIRSKHLLTLETAISENQTREMRNEHLQLVVPRGLHNTYSPSQQEWLLDVSGFTEIVRERQARVDVT